MVYYTEETPGVNKRMVAGYYLFLCLIGFAILLGPTGSGIPITLLGDRVRGAHELATPDMGDLTDPESCIGGSCHTDEFNYWNETGHATAVTANSTYVFIGSHVERTWADFNGTCAQCHATNWNNATYPNTHDGIDVRCGACHDLTSPYYSVDADTCGICHTTSTNPHYFVDDWANSAHANSLTDLRGNSHASSSCMHCMSAEGFIDPTATDLDPNGAYNSLTCPACHSVHSADVVNPAQIRAVNSTELCGLCHSGSRYPMYDTFTAGPHALTGVVDCVSCHGWQQGAHGAVTNHTFFIVNATATCGQGPECHEGQEAWALSQLEEIQSSFDALVSDFETEATDFEAIVTAYNETADADYELTSYVMGVLDDAASTVSYYQADSSSGFHDPKGTFDALNSAFRDLLNAEAYYYENLPVPTTTTTTGGGGVPLDTLFIVGGAAGGIIVGLLLGVLVGRRR